MPDKEKEALKKLTDALKRAVPNMSGENFNYILGYSEAIAECGQKQREKETREHETAATV